MSQSSAQQGSGDVLVMIDTSRSELSVTFCCLHPCPSVGAYFESITRFTPSHGPITSHHLQ
jgi:hypothetical protein